MTSHPWFWLFNAGILLLLALDLFVLNRKPQQVTLRKATLSSLAWVCLSLTFNAAIWRWKGEEKGLEFLTGYLIEYALSVDNIFLFAVIFSYFRVEPQHQHRVLFWGIIGALVMRGVMIFIGVELVIRFSWVLYLFGVFLFVTGIRMAFSTEGAVDLEKNLVLRLCRRWMRVTPEAHGSRFFIRQAGVWMLTPLALVLVVIDVMDLIFAVDSIPAVFAITRDPFIVYSSNICAILGLRSLYFLLAHVMQRFVYLKFGLATVLSFIGVKMLLAGVLEIPIGLSLGIVAVCLLASIVASLFTRETA